MRPIAFILIAALLAVSLPPSAAGDDVTIRVATFNVSMNRSQQGELLRDLMAENTQIRQVARILRSVRPDIVLLNEFDFDNEGQSVQLFKSRYLENADQDLPVLEMPYAFNADVNTGLASGLDLNNNGKLNDAADAHGFGMFPGQYGMVLLSRFPIDRRAVRTFQKLLWSSMPMAARPIDSETGKTWYSDDIWKQLRLSSKSHWDIPVEIDGRTIHILASHPTPPAFDGPEDRNGCRNHDEIRLWAEYISNNTGNWISDDNAQLGGLPPNSHFMILGDQNADPLDGGSHKHAISQLLRHPLVNSEFIPSSQGGAEASRLQGLANKSHQSDPRFDTSDFSDQVVGNLRADYVLPSRTLRIIRGEVFWPTMGEQFSNAIECSDHRLVWLDIAIP